MLPTHLTSGEPALVEEPDVQKIDPSEADPYDLEPSSSVQATAAGVGSDYSSVGNQDPEDSEDTNTDHDSAVGSLGSYASSTYTVSSSIAERVEENGRTYHVYKDGKYMLPNDEIELNRLDIQHKMWLVTLDDKLHLAPLGSTPQNVLDLATGTGNWAIEFADTYPSSSVLGTDLSLIQPEYVPPNCRFEIDDVEDDWIFPFKFDYIHGRALATCFQDPQSIISKAYESLVPGGWFELQDVCMQTSEDGSHRGTTLEEVQEYIAEGTKATGRSWDNVPNYKRWMVARGFEDVAEHHFRWPTNSLWPTEPKEKILGAWFQAQVDSGMLEAAVTRLFMMKLGWSKEKLVTFLSMVRKDLRNPLIKCYSPMTVVYGRKPL